MLCSAHAAKFTDFSELNLKKYALSAEMCPISKSQESALVCSVHPPKDLAPNKSTCKTCDLGWYLRLSKDAK